jgi:hypothetical protein
MRRVSKITGGRGVTMRTQLKTELNYTKPLRRATVIVSVICVWAALPTARASAQACVPDCRDGYTCHRGECVSACNPGCGDGEVCNADGECLATSPTQSTLYQSQRSVPLEDRAKPKVTVPATFVALGGVLLIAGGVTFGSSAYDDFGYWTGGHYAGLGLMTMGAISLISATPLLAIRVRDKRQWDRRAASRNVQELALAPNISPAGKSKEFGLTLRGKF